MSRPGTATRGWLLALVLPALLAVLPIGGYLAYISWSEGLERQRVHTLAMLAALAPAGEFALLTGDPRHLDGLLRSETLGRSFSGLIVLDADGTVFLEAGQAQHLAPAGTPTALDQFGPGRASLRLGRPIRRSAVEIDDRLLGLDDERGAEVLGWILAEVDLRPLRGEGLRTLALGLLIALGAALAAARLTDRTRRSRGEPVGTATTRL